MKEALLQSTLIQGAVTLILVVTVAYVNVTGGTVSPEVVQTLSLAMGFWFGAKTTQAAYKGPQIKG